MIASATAHRRIFAAVLLICLAVSLFCLAYPLYVIRPFRHQGAPELELALAITRFRSMITPVIAVSALLALIGYWRVQPLKWRRGLSAIGAGLVVLLSLLASVNVYEVMFHPDSRPSFSPARQIKLDGTEAVVAVRIDREARAYPIRGMSYHHVINDVLGGVPIVATY